MLKLVNKLAKLWGKCRQIKPLKVLKFFSCLFNLVTLQSYSVYLCLFSTNRSQTWRGYFLQGALSSRVDRFLLTYPFEKFLKSTERWNVNLYHVTKFSIYLSFTVYYNYTKIGRFTPILSITICYKLFLSAHFSFLKFLNLNLTFAICCKRDT